MKEFFLSKYVRYVGYGLLTAGTVVSLALREWWKAAIAGIVLVLFWWSDTGKQSEDDPESRE